MPTTLNSGLQLPDKGSVDWYSSMQNNYGLLDNHLENTDTHVTAEDKANWNSKQGSLSQDQLDAIAQVATNTDDIATLQSSKADASHTHSSSDITDIDDYATKDYVDTSISSLVDNAPDALNTLNELSAALNDDSNFASTVTTALADKANSADLATVATSGSYNDLDDKPAIPTNTSDLTNDSDFVVSSNLATVATSGDYDDLSNKPSIPTNTSDLNNDSGFVTLNDFDIPSKTSDLTNDSGFITSSDVPISTSDLINDSNFVDTSNSAVASGITSAKVTDYDTHIADTDIHVTTTDKATWNTVTSKANDSDVVHKSGDETSTGFKQFANIRVTNSIKAINLENTTTDLNNCYSDFAFSDGSRAGNIQYYYCNTDSGTANISNLPETKAFFLTSITTRLLSNYLYVKQVLINSNNKTFTRYCNNSTWGSWVNETDSEYVHKSGNETVGGQKTLVNLLPLKGEALGTEASNNARSLLYFLANRDTQNQSGIFLTKFRQNKAQGDMSGNDIAYLSFDCLENSVRTNNGFRINFLNFVGDIPQRFILWSGITERLLGTTGAPWSGVYATNYYYGNDNVEFSTKFVTTDTAQTITETKTFTNTIKSQKEIEFTGNRLAYILPDFSASYSGLNLCTYSSNGAVRIGTWKVDDNDNTKHKLDSSLGYLNVTTGSINSVNCVYVTPRNANDSKLGDSTNKWKSFNGLNPGALSMPSGNTSDMIDISSYITLFDGTNNGYTPPADGWICISGKNCTAIYVYRNNYWGVNSFSPTADTILVAVPVVSGVTFAIKVIGQGLNYAKFVPCQGNV